MSVNRYATGKENKIHTALNWAGATRTLCFGAGKCTYEGGREGDKEDSKFREHFGRIRCVGCAELRWEVLLFIEK